jgi:diguanylate cyclase (GGDEF)-like protein
MGLKATWLKWIQWSTGSAKPFLDLFLILMLTGLSLWGINRLNISQVIETIELSIFDLRVSLSADYQLQKPSRDIVLVVFDDDTLAEFEHIYGAWPWSRQVHADLINFMNRASIKLAVFDIMFVGHGKDNKDSSLVNAYLNSPNVYLGYNLTYNIPETLQRLLKPLPGVRVAPYDTLLKHNPHFDWIFFNNPSLNMNGYRPLVPGLMQNPKRLGVINHLRDRDGVSRGNPLIYKVLMPDGKGGLKVAFMPYLGLKILLDQRGFDWENDTLTVTPNNHLVWKDLNVPIRQDGQMLINWLSSTPKPYVEIPARYLLESLLREKAHKTLPIDKQLKAFLKNKTVFIGATAVSTFDIKTTSIQRLFPGVTYQATLFDNLIHGTQFIRRLDTIYTILISGALSILGCFFLIRIRSAAIAYSSVVLLALAYVLVTQVLFIQFRLWIDLAQPLLMYAAMVIITFAVKYMSRELDYRKTYKLATTDSLTGLYNHRYFMEQAQLFVEGSKDGKSRFAIVLVDIDHFKKFNDTYGHLIGDAVLRAVAQTLKQNVRSIDIVCRYGGEEMAILLARTSLDEALQVANKLVHTIANTKHNLGPGVTRQVTISAGVASFPQHGKTIMELIEHSDKGLYLAKDGGRNQVGLAATSQQKAEAAQKAPFKAPTGQ